MQDAWKMLILCAPLAFSACSPPPEIREPLDLGSRRQLLLDDSWFDQSDNVELTLHRPIPRENVIQCDRPWEGKSLHYTTVVDDGGTFRMWYRVSLGDPRVDSPNDTVLTCYAESRDGIVWEKPNLGRYDFEGSTENNILGPPEDFTNISVLLDPNQEAGSGTRYKMISRVNGISGFVSPDGIRWTPVATNPLLSNGPFDSHNILLWDDERERYVIYLRGIDPSVPGSFKGGRRAIRRSESSDFLHWTEPKLVFTADELDPADFHLYTNAAVKYSRAASAFFMFPMILYTDRSYPGAPYPGLSDVRFAYSRDGIRWERSFREPFLTPGTGRAQLAGPQSHRGAGRDPDRDRRALALLLGPLPRTGEPDPALHSSHRRLRLGRRPLRRLGRIHHPSPAFPGKGTGTELQDRRRRLTSGGDPGCARGKAGGVPVGGLRPPGRRPDRRGGAMDVQSRPRRPFRQTRPAAGAPEGRGNLCVSISSLTVPQAHHSSRLPPVPDRKTNHPGVES